MSRTTIPTPVTTETATFARQLLARLGNEPLTLGNATTGESTPLPPQLADLIHKIIVSLAIGQSVEVAEQRHEFTPNEAAEFLNVSRPFVVKLMDEGTLPFRQVGTHRRIPHADLAAYRDEQSVRSRKAMKELVKLSEEMGLYDLEPMPDKSAYRDPSGRTE